MFRLHPTTTRAVRGALRSAAAFCLLATPLLAQSEWKRMQTTTTENLVAMDMPSATIGYAAGEVGVILKSTDAGATWSEQTSGVSGGFWAIRFSSPTDGLAGGDDGIIVGTTDGGTTWTSRPSGLANGALQSFVFGIYYLTPTTVFATGGDGEASMGAVLKSTDAGMTWKKTTLDGWLFVDRCAFTSPTHGYIVGASFTGGKIGYTTDGGATWQTTYTAADLVTSIAPTGENTAIAAGTGGGIYATTDGGASWMRRPNTISNDLLDMTFRDTTEGAIVGSDGAVLSTTDGGITWNPGTITGGGLLTDAVYQPGTGNLFTTGSSGGIFRRKATPVASVLGGRRTERITLAPNPLLGGATLRLAGADDVGVASVALYDMSGKLVWRGAPSAGGNLDFNSASLSSGRYVYVARSEKGIVSRGLLVLP